MTLGDLTRTTEQRTAGEQELWRNVARRDPRDALLEGARTGSVRRRAAGGGAAFTTPRALSADERALLDRPIADLNLSVRARKCMVRLGMTTIGELVRRTGDDLLECKNFGVTSLNEVREKLTAGGPQAPRRLTGLDGCRASVESAANDMVGDVPPSAAGQPPSIRMLSARSRRLLAADAATCATCSATPHGEVPLPTVHAGRHRRHRQGRGHRSAAADRRRHGARQHLSPGAASWRGRGGRARRVACASCGWEGPILTDSGGFQIFSLAETSDDHRAGGPCSARTSTARGSSLSPERVDRDPGSTRQRRRDGARPRRCAAGRARRNRRCHAAERAMGRTVPKGRDAWRPGPVRHRPRWTGRRSEAGIRRAAGRARLCRLRDRRPERWRGARRDVPVHRADGARTCPPTSRGT